MTKVEKILKKNSAITLITLVVTIVILLILAGIALVATLGDNGIIQTTEQASLQAKRAEIISKINFDVLYEELNTGEITEDKLKEILDRYGDIIYDGEDIIGVAPDDLDEDISLDEIYVGEITNYEYVSQEESYVGYYLDIDGNKIPDALIFDDDQSVEEGKYYISNTDYSGIFGTRDVISVLERRR